MRRKMVASIAGALIVAAGAVGAIYSDNGFAVASPLHSVVPGATSGTSVHSTGLLTASQAQRAVWAQPAVQLKAAQLRAKGARPFTMIESAPDPYAAPGTRPVYIVYFGEDLGDHVVRIDSYQVDARTGKVTLLDPLLAP